MTIRGVVETPQAARVALAVLVVALCVGGAARASAEDVPPPPPLALVFPEDADLGLRVRAAIESFEAGRSDEAAHAFDELTLVGPTLSTAWLGVVRARMALGDFGGAARAADRLASLDPGRVEVPIARAIVAFEVNDRRAARAALWRARALAPEPWRIDLAMRAVGAGVRPLDALALDVPSARVAASQLEANTSLRSQAHVFGGFSALPRRACRGAALRRGHGLDHGRLPGRRLALHGGLHRVGGARRHRAGAPHPSFVTHARASARDRLWSRSLQLNARGLVLRW
jgi:tetratricopeptide (TPR) repeat protein